MKKVFTLLLFVTSFALIAAGHRIPGEVLPELAPLNLLKNGCFKDGAGLWKIIRQGSKSSVSVVKIDDFPALQVKRTSGKGFVALISASCPVEAGKKYLMTALYNCRKTEFGAFARMEIVPYNQIDAYIAGFQKGGYYIAMGKTEIIGRKAGDWIRRTASYTAPANVKQVCVVIIQYGAPVTVEYSSVYFGPQPPKRAFDKAKYYSDSEPAVSPEKLAAICKSRKPAEASVVKYGDVPAFQVNGRIVPPLMYLGDAFNPKRSKVQAFRKAGINLQVLCLNRQRAFWKGKGEYDFKKIDRYLRYAISRNPYGDFIVQIDVSPYQRWSDEYPGHVAVDINGKPTTGRHGRKAPPSYWSELYRQQACEYVNAVVVFLKKQPYYSSIAGFFLCGNEDGQFYYNSVGRTLQNGRSPAAVAAFRKYLKEQYGTVQALRKAWNRKDVTFTNAAVPVKAKRIKTTFLNPAKQQDFIDFIRFLNVSMAGFANQLCRTAKNAAGKPVLSVMWWGRGAAQLVYPHFGQTDKIFPADDLNVMGSQAGYYGERENGCTCFMPWVYDSARIHRKITMLEADFRTWKSPYKSMQHDYHVARYWNLYDLKGAALRDFGKQIAVGGGLWWYDMSAGWFNDPEIMKLIGKMSDVAAELYSKPVKVSPAEIALVVDEQNFFRTTEQLDVWNGPNYHALRLGQRAFLRSGLKYDFIYFSDIIAGNRDNYKVYIFMNLWMITPEQRKFIDNRLKKQGKTLIWLYAPGYLTPKGLSVENMKKITGIGLELKGRNVGKAHFLSGKHALLNGLNGKLVGLGMNLYGPRFAVKDAGARSLAAYQDGSTAIAVKAMSGWNSIYVGITSGFSPSFLQNIARFSGVHVYNTPGDMFVYHRDDLICLHGVEGNVNKLSFPQKVDIIDLMTNRTLLQSGRKLEVGLKPGESRLLKINIKDKGLKAE